MEDRYLTIKEAAEFLSVGRQHVYNLIDQGKLPAKNIGLGEMRILRVLLSDLVLFNTPEDQQ